MLCPASTSLRTSSPHVTSGLPHVFQCLSIAVWPSASTRPAFLPRVETPGLPVSSVIRGVVSGTSALRSSGRNPLLSFSCLTVMAILRDHIRLADSPHCVLAFKKDGTPKTERILNLTLEIIFLLTGEDFVLTRKQNTHPARGVPSTSESSPQSPITEVSCRPAIEEESESDKDPCRAAEEVAVKCEDVAVYLSVDEWHYLEGHREHYMDVVTGTSRPLLTDECRDEAPTDRCGSALYPQGCTEAQGRTIAPDDQVGVGGGIVHCKEEEAEPDLMATEEHAGRKPEASGGSVSWPPFCAEEEERTAAQDYQEAAIDGVIHCKEEEEADDLHTGLQGNLTNPHGSYQLFFPGPTPPDPDGEITAVGPQISDDCPERRELRREAPAEERSPVTGSPEQHFIVGSAPSPAVDSPKGAIGAPKKLEGVTRMIYKCRYCQQSYSNKIELLEHQRTHSSLRLYRCTECAQNFTDSTALVAHQWTFHRQRPVLKDKPFICNQCGHSFTKKSALVKHQRLHTGDFSCPDCGKCLSDKTGLILHRRTHTGEKPFSCSECGKRFTQMCHLVTHQSVHTGARPFTCAECGKCFSIRSVLDAHQAIHDRHKTWSCSDCGKSFTQKSSLVTHQRVHQKSAS